MSKKSDRIAAKAAKTVKERHKKDEAATPPEPTGSVIPDPEPVVAKGRKQPKAVTESGLTPLPKMPSAGGSKSRKPKPFNSCACGCGGQTRSLWVPGHDARAKGWALRIERNIVTMDQVPVNERAGAVKMLEARKGINKTGIKLVSKPEPVAVNE